MVGNIGTMARVDPSPRTRMEAVDYAFKIVNDDAAQEESLNQLKQAASHNQEIYDKAANALQELSTKERELRGLETSAKALMAEAQEAERRNETWFAEKSGQITIAGRELDVKRGAFEAETQAAKDALVLRENAVKAIAAQNGDKGKEVDLREVAVSEREAAVSKREAHVEAIAGDLKVVLERL